MNDTARRERRLHNWRQTPACPVATAGDAAALIEQLGLVTHFPVTAELPNLFHAHTGSPSTKVAPEHGGPSGRVYTWRWELGRLNAGFYTAIVRKRPTWVSWALLPAVLRLRGELRTVDETFDAGALSPGAYRIAQALEAAGGVLATGDLRRAAGFPTGKEQRSAFLKAVEELDTRLMLAKAFAPEDEDMRHALVEVVHQDHLVAAARLTREEAVDCFLGAYLPHAVYAAPSVLARDLGFGLPELTAGLERLAVAGQARQESLPRYKGMCYVWVD